MFALSGSICHGYGNLQFIDENGIVVNSLWDQRSYDSAGFPDGIPWLLDEEGTRGAIDIDIDVLKDLVNAAFETWEAVPGSDIAFVFGGLTSGHAVGDPGDGGHHLPPHPGLDGDNVISFDELTGLPSGVLALTYVFTLSDDFTFDNSDDDPNNDTDFGGMDLNPDIPEGTYPAGTILDADIVVDTLLGLTDADFEWSTTGETGKYDLQSILVHEIGHFVGHCHSCVDDRFPSVMYPIALANPDGVRQQQLKADDIAGISHYYPSESYSNLYGSISGRLEHKADAQGIAGGHVTATLTTDPSQIVGVYTDESGYYSIDGLEPGGYIIRAKPLGAMSIYREPGDRINEVISQTHDVSFLPCFYPSEYKEGNATPVNCGAGEDTPGIDFRLGDGDTPDALEQHSATDYAVEISTDGKAVTLNATGDRDRDWLEFSALEGQSFLIETSGIGLNPSMLLVLYAPDKKTVLATSLHPESRQSSTISLSARETGHYYILLDSLGIASGEGTHVDVSVTQFEPATYYVDGVAGSDEAGDGSSERPWSSITQALSAVSGTRQSPTDVLVAAGTYNELINMKKYVCLRGGYDSSDWTWDAASNLTILDGSGSGPIVTGEDFAQIEGFVVANGQATFLDLGGGMLCRGRAPLINNCRIEKCSALLGGGGLGIGGFSGARVVNCSILHCEGGNGGGIYISDSTPVIIGNKFIGCEAGIPQGFGGGICIENSWLVSGYIMGNAFLDCDTLSLSTGRGGGICSVQGHRTVYEGNVFIECQSAYGGAFAMGPGSYSGFSFRNNRVVNCSATEMGGGIYTTSSYDNPTTSFDGNIIMSCSALYGGGIAHENGTGLDQWIHSNLIGWNRAQEEGGGIFVGGDRTPTKIRNNTFVGNESALGSAISCSTNDASPEVANNIFTDNIGSVLYEHAKSFGMVRNNDFWETDTLYYDYDSNMGYVDIDAVNTLVLNDPHPVEGNVDWNPSFAPVSNGILSNVIYDPNTFQSTMTDIDASFTPGGLKSLIINPDVKQSSHYLIVSNTETTVTAWGDITIAAQVPCSYRIVDYHLATNSLNINAGLDILEEVPDEGEINPIRSDIDSDDRPLYGQLDIGADEVFPMAGDSEPDEDIDLADFAFLLEEWLANCAGPDWCAGRDTGQDGWVNLPDFAWLATNWLAGSE
jgi:hypothetical protein